MLILGNSAYNPSIMGYASSIGDGIDNYNKDANIGCDACPVFCIYL